jgi:hypothetical protein
MSFGDIGKVLKENFEEQETKPTAQQSKYSRALQLFESGKGLFEVAV